jgi:hypothetical protein
VFVTAVFKSVSGRLPLQLVVGNGGSGVCANDGALPESGREGSVCATSGSLFPFVAWAQDTKRLPGCSLYDTALAEL